MKKIILGIIFLLGILQVQAQKNEADEKYRLFQFAKAIPLYEKHLSKNDKDYESFLRLATSYKLVNDIPQSIRTYKTLVQLPESKPNDLFDLVQLLQITQQQGEARQYALKYKEAQPGEKADNLIKSLDNYNFFMASQNDYTLSNKTKQYPFSVLSVYPLSGKLIVTAESKNDNSNKWTGRSFTDLYSTDASFGKLDRFAENIMTNLDDGIPTFTPDEKVIYFTSVNKETVSENSINTRKLHIVWSEMVDGKWNAAKDFPFNANAYSTAHPSISKDGQLLVFASDMPGGKGGMDLYLCKKEGTGWSAPQNISAANTSGNELFPVFQNQNELYFSSNGLPGLGGLDLFKTKYSNGTFSNPENAKAPLNSSYDDYYLSSNNNLQTGYLTSNREGSTQIDNVFYFEKAKSAPVDVVAENKAMGLQVKVLDKYTSTPLPYVSVSVKNDKGETMHQGMSDENGTVLVDELAKGNYSIQGTLNDVTTTIAKVVLDDFNASAAYIQKQVLHNDPRFTMRGLVVNANTGAPIEGVKVKCVNQSLGKEREVITRANGEFFFQLEQNSDFKVNGQKAKWLSSETAEETTKGLDRSKELYVKLKISMQEPTANAVIRLKKIFYAYDKCDIRPASALELDRLIKLMNDYPDMIIELGSHTDSRGSDEYNRKLSQCRADAAAAYLISKGIPKNRFTAKGYGETMLVNNCANGVECTDAQHEENRRTEFKIIQCSSCPGVAD